MDCPCWILKALNNLEGSKDSWLGIVLRSLVLGNPSASLLERIEEVQSMCFMTGLWRVICTEIGHLECPPPIAKGCKVDVRLLGWHHRRGRRQRSVYQIFKAVSPWRAGHSNAPAFWPQHVDRKASQFYCFSLVTKLCLTLGTPL